MNPDAAVSAKLLSTGDPSTDGTSAVGAESRIVALTYIARAGLLPEITRQTYDSLYKALREVILNSVDAGASQISIDLQRLETDRTLEIIDDGSGMTLSEIQTSFMSLGGSRKFEANDKFGRIGIGSLALMHYAQAVEIETKQAGSRSITKAVISHPWQLDQKQRAVALHGFPAGEAWEEATSAVSDHFTVFRLRGVNDVLLAECADVAKYYKLLDRLRRILPLPWRDGPEVARQLAASDPQLAELLREHTSRFRAQVVVRSRWSTEDPLTKRLYGDGVAQDERWHGAPHAFSRKVVVDDWPHSREIQIAGYLLSQVRPSIEWNGLTARVQNVAVEESTFFDLDSDPGFRKYISGEAWLLGDIDCTRLVNIDRASFNRESADYQAISRAMQSELSSFKSQFVQRPRRAKVAIKRRLEQQVALVEIAERLAGNSAVLAAKRGLEGDLTRQRATQRIRVVRSRSLIDDLNRMGALPTVVDKSVVNANPYAMEIAGDGCRILVHIHPDLATPSVLLGKTRFALRLVEGRAVDPPLSLKRRPRELLLNLAHPSFGGEPRPIAIEMVLTLELSSLLTNQTTCDFYNTALALISNALD